MGVTQDTNPQAKRHIPLFGKGVLVFEESGHTLTRNKGYVCSKKQKGECNRPEQRIKVESLERNFARLAKSFEIPDKEKLPAVKRLIGEILHGQVDELLESDDFEHDLFDTSVMLMAEDIENNDEKKFKADAKEAVGAMKKESERNAEFVCGLLIGVIFAFAKKSISEMQAGRVLSYLSKKVYLSNDGKIVKIQLHDFGEYAFQYMKRRTPGYTEPFKWFTLGRKFETLNYKAVAKSIRTGKLDLTIPAFAVGSTLARTMNVIPNIQKLDAKAVLQLLFFLNESPIGKMALDVNKFVKKRKREK